MSKIEYYGSIISYIGNEYIDDMNFLVYLLH